MGAGEGDTDAALLCGKPVNWGYISRNCCTDAGSRLVVAEHMRHLINPVGIPRFAAHWRHRLWSQTRIRASSKSVRQSEHCIHKIP